MWHARLYTHDDMYYQFEAWLASDTALDELALNESRWGEPCLLDIVATWVASGDEAARLPNYDTFLIGLFYIVREWVSDLRNPAPAGHDGLRFWPNLQNGQRREVKELFPKDYIDRGYSVGVVHELFNRSAFEAAQNLARQRAKAAD